MKVNGSSYCTAWPVTSHRCAEILLRQMPVWPVTLPNFGQLLLLCDRRRQGSPCKVRDPCTVNTPLQPQDGFDRIGQWCLHRDLVVSVSPVNKSNLLIPHVWQLKCCASATPSIIYFAALCDSTHHSSSSVASSSSRKQCRACLEEVTALFMVEISRIRYIRQGPHWQVSSWSSIVIYCHWSWCTTKRYRQTHGSCLSQCLLWLR